jgi:hypothetical protein
VVEVELKASSHARERPGDVDESSGPTIVGDLLGEDGQLDQALVEGQPRRSPMRDQGDGAAELEAWPGGGVTMAHPGGRMVRSDPSGRRDSDMSLRALCTSVLKAASDSSVWEKKQAARMSTSSSPGTRRARLRAQRMARAGPSKVTVTCNVLHHQPPGRSATDRERSATR